VTTPARATTRKGPPKFRQRDTFQGYLRSRVDRYLRTTGKHGHGGWRMAAKSAIICAWVVASYLSMVFLGHYWLIAIPAAISLGFAAAAVGFNIQHDAGHRSYFTGKRGNRLMAYSLDVMGGSSFLWNIKHNKLHHTYTNIDGHDDDIDLGILGRLSPNQPRLWFHRYQHFYLWAGYALLAIKWQLLDDFRDMIRGRIGTFKFARPRGAELAGFLLGKTVFGTFAFVIPIMLCGFTDAIIGYLAAMGICGIVMATVFQLAHVVEPADYPMPDATTNEMADAWAVHQVHTTVNFAPRSRIQSWLFGGLNFQTEHHLFPHISHLHYPWLSRIVEHACHRFDMPYNVHPSLFSAIASHFRQLRRLGQPA
jgi:linoleoyl-CoA desaturase